VLVESYSTVRTIWKEKPSGQKKEDQKPLNKGVDIKHAAFQAEKSGFHERRKNKVADESAWDNPKKNIPNTKDAPLLPVCLDKLFAL